MNKSKNDFEDELLLKAMRAYKRVCDKHITVYDRKGNAYPFPFYVAPSWYSCEVGRKYVYLRNCNGLIARYDIKKREITF